MTPVSISSGLVPNPSPSTPFVPPTRSDWDLLFQPMFDESLNVDFHAPEVIAHIQLERVMVDRTIKRQYNLDYFFVKRIQCARATPTANLPYGIVLTLLSDKSWKQGDCGKAHQIRIHSSSSSSSRHVHLINMMRNDVETSRSKYFIPTT
ncbi:hypothetical protein Tco_1252364 [Tanacetum coccineum]